MSGEDRNYKNLVIAGKFNGKIRRGRARKISLWTKWHGKIKAF